ncbi:MAG: four helix bundle protein [Anaerolineaceae bacterium]|nr:four helix bundle protein [Anaerolineaceae bacterium]
MQDFKKLAVWEKAHRFTLSTYQATMTFPKEESYGLTNQVRWAAASIPANIAEGCGRDSTKEFRRFLDIAMGSASETEYHLLLAHDLNYLNTDDYQTLSTMVVEVKRMLAGLIKKLTTER